jgi:hypothetical protein
MGRRPCHIGVCLAVGALAACSSNLAGNVSPDATASPDASAAPDTTAAPDVPATPDAAPTCPTAQEPADGKITEADRLRFAATSGSMVVLISVEGGAQVGPLPDCPTDRSCPERDAAISRMEQENLASQGCVRGLIANTGGTADPTSFWLINAFTASLTWDQIQIVAGHPDVLHIESNGGAPPP